ncbi:MAG: hypothetical protein JWQ70_2856 [Aeromicrobium sp.]|nr:hypothetical protein [Aeromicrobium sp.]
MGTVDPDVSPLLADYALHLRRSSLTLAAHSLRFRTVEGPELLARLASRGKLGYDETLACARDLLEGRLDPQAALALLDPYALSSLARAMAGGVAAEPDFTDSADLARAVRMICGDTILAWDAVRIEAQTNLLSGHADHAMRMLDTVHMTHDTEWMIRTELLHPSNHPGQDSTEGWLDAFNQAFRDHGLLEVSITPGSGAMFDRLAVDVPDNLRLPLTTPLVTVIVSTYKPDQSLMTALGSLINQTWQNLEILLVDDCSPAEFDDLLAEGEALDPRIRLIRLSENVGTYVIRNRAIAQSHGEYVAILDSDDWSHPQRIERQVSALDGPTPYLASHTGSIRVHHDLSTVSVGLSSFRKAAASLLFRKDVVISALGGFDEVRKAADTEFSARIDLVFGDATLDLPDPLVFTQLTDDSLSRAEFGFEWHHPARVAHRAGWYRWHREIRAGRASAFVAPGGPRPFVGPHRIRTGRTAPPSACDAVLLADWRPMVSRGYHATAQLAALSDAGLSVGAAHSVSARYFDRLRLGLRDEMLALQEEGRARLVLWEEPVDIGVLIVTDPELLTLTPQPVEVRLRPRRAVIVAGHPPRAPQGGWLTYDPAVVERNVRTLFGVDPSWLPAHDGIAGALEKEGATGAMLPSQHTGVVESRPRIRPGLRGGSRPIIGTTGLEGPKKDRPSFGLLRRLLPADGSYDVRLRVDPGVIEEIVGDRRLPLRWLVLDESRPPEDFLRQLDVFIGIPMRSWGPEPSWAAIEAMAHGAVTILDPAYEEQFGDAALYAQPDDVPQLLKNVTADPARFARQQERGYAFVRGLSAAAWQRRVRDLLASEGAARQ